MSETIVKIEQLSKRFFVLKSERTLLRTLKALIKRKPITREHWALRNLSFDIKRGDKLAIVGKNGSGKTTLLRIISGIYDATSGGLKVEVGPKVLFKSWAWLNGNLSLVDNVYLFGAVHGIERNILKQRAKEILEIAELYDLRFSFLKELSLGQQQRLALSVFFQNDSDFLIFDESLAFVDEGFAQKCESFFQNMSSSEKTMVMTSHNSSILKKYCKTAIWLDEGSIRMFGEAKEVINEYEWSLKNVIS